jgi:hypothetical protein
VSLEELAAWLELQQSQRDYRATWLASPYSGDAEFSAWKYNGSAYKAWAHITNA